jgi:hypothetical protein
MRAIPPAGFAPHGFFGFVAKTFGNPTGAASGTGYYPGPQPAPVGGNWVARTPPLAGANITAVGGNASRIVLFTDAPAVLYSDNQGETWSTAAPPPFTNFMPTMATNGTNLWVAADNTGSSFVSIDGATWTVGGIIATPWSGFPVIVFGAGIFIVSSGSNEEGDIFLSANGLLWSAATGTEPNQGNLALYDGSHFVATALTADGSNVAIASSPDGNVWTSGTAAAFEFQPTMAYNPAVNLYIAGGGSPTPVVQRSNSRDWVGATTEFQPLDETVIGVAFGANTWVLAGQTSAAPDPQAAISTGNAVAWIQEDMAMTAGDLVQQIGFFGGVFVAAASPSNDVSTRLPNA